jgi:hypothetical protein
LNAQSIPTRCLLDKNIVRAAIAGLRFGLRRPLLPAEFDALALWRAAEQAQPAVELFIPFTSAHILAVFADYAEVRLLLESTVVLWPGPYTRRWRRRLRDTTGLTAEDAMILALGTFGTNAAGDILGMPVIVTADQPLLNGYSNHTDRLRRRLRAMTSHLLPPFDQAMLPRLAAPETLIAEWTDTSSA